jgi:Immunity protein Imm1
MFVTKFSIDEWIGTQNKESIESVNSWQSVESAIKQLDGQHKTLVTLETDGGEIHMSVGGGQGKYIVYVTFDNESFDYLVDPNKSSTEELLIVGGQLGHYPARSCVDLDMTLKSAKAFAEKGELLDSLIWEKDAVVELV